MHSIAGLLVAGLLLTTGVAAQPGSSCEGSSTWTHCDVSNSGSQVDIGANINQPGPPVSDAGGGGDAPPSEPGPPPERCPTQPERCGFIVVTPPDVTAADLASFRPAQPSLTGEPTGFGLVGAPTNVVAAASEQLIPGTLLGWEVVVRFVPAAYVFEYGDGSTARVNTGGQSWQSLGQAQFTPTATSHVYRERGTYPVSVTVQYAASVDFGSGTWRPVTGYVSATTGGYGVRVVEARTALVDRTCLENPSGPGC